jgi:hypothetical protein
VIKPFGGLCKMSSGRDGNQWLGSAAAGGRSSISIAQITVGRMYIDARYFPLTS